MEKGDVAWSDFIESVELFFNGDTWCGISWCGMLLKFSKKYFSMEKDDIACDDMAYLHVQRIEINDL
jgi:hypothetical protein